MKVKEHIFYHFWSIERDGIPYDNTQEYTYSSEANDLKFIELAKKTDDGVSIGEPKRFFKNNLIAYINLHYTPQIPDSINSLAIEWFNHTADVISKHRPFSYNPININDVEDIISEYSPVKFIYFSIVNESVISEQLFSKTDAIVTQFLKSDKINKNESMVDTEINNPPLKVKTVAMLELLKLMKKGKSHNDLSKICRFVSFLTGQSYDKIYNDAQKGIVLTKYHKKDIDKINKIFKELTIDVELKTDIEY